jgi:8-oxo-dGTP pyrophosphatase MutT (NUDIX family)
MERDQQVWSARAVVDTTPPEARGWPVVRARDAGGVVVHDGRVLLLHRRVAGQEEVKLPGGRLEPGEAPVDCALREVREETGLDDVTVVAYLGTVDSRFAFGGRRYERDEAWYLMRSAGAAGGPPEAGWDPVLDWLSPGEVEAALTYASEKLAARWAVAALDRERG